MNLTDVVGRARHLVLNELSTFEGGDLGGVRAHMDTHQVAADSLSLAGPAPTTLECPLVEFDRLTRHDRLDRRWRLPVATLSLLTTLLLVGAGSPLTAATPASSAAPAPLARRTLPARLLIALVTAVPAAGSGSTVTNLRGWSTVADLGFVAGALGLRRGLRGLGLFVGHSSYLSFGARHEGSYRRPQRRRRGCADRHRVGTSAIVGLNPLVKSEDPVLNERRIEG